jgi:hypothetical protein
MTAVVLVVVAGLAIVLLLAVSQMGSRRRNAARADLAREKQTVVEQDILALVQEEVAETGVDQIPGADGVDITVRLRVWHRDAEVRDECAGEGRLRFQVDEDAEPSDASADQVRLVCDPA